MADSMVLIARHQHTGTLTPACTAHHTFSVAVRQHLPYFLCVHYRNGVHTRTHAHLFALDLVSMWPLEFAFSYRVYI